MSQVTVKAYLKRGGQQKRLLEQSDEIRRFGIDCDVSSNFEYLVAKIVSVFPGLKNNSITVYWKDCDGDMIAFSSDDELMEALKSITDGMFRVYVVEKKQSSHGAAPAAESSNVLHFGVTCDGCQGPVRGIRYKCKACPDYDLCMGCKAQSIHNEHEMTAIEQPQCHFSGADREAFFANLMQSNPFQQPAGGPPPFGFHMPPPPPPAYGCFPPAPGMAPPAPGMPSAEPGAADCADARRMNRRAWKRWYKEMWCDHKRKCKKDKKEKREKCKEKKEGKSSSSSSSDSEVESPTGDYLQNVGQSVAAMLDPLGIDVEVDVEHHGRRRRCHRDLSGQPWAAWGMRGGHGHGPWGQRGGHGPGGHGPWGQRGGPGGWGMRGHCSPWGMRGGSCGRGGRGAGWAGGCPWGRGFDLSGMAAPGSTPAAAPGSSTSQDPTEQKSAADASATANDQPDVETNLETGEMGANGADHEWMLVNNGGSPSAADITDSVRDLHVADAAAAHSDLMSFSGPSAPHVAEALESMMSMGYTNEGGWLTSLLVHHNGDIGRVLDTLHAKK